MCRIACPAYSPSSFNSTSTFYFPLPPSFDPFSHVPFSPLPPPLPSPLSYLSFLSFSRFPPLALASSPFLFPSLSLFTRLRFETDVGRKPRSVTRRRRVTGSPIPYPTQLRDLLGRNTSELAEYLLAMLRSRLGSAGLPPFPYVREEVKDRRCFLSFPYSYIFLHIRVLTFILFHVRSNGILDSCNFSLSLSRLLIPFRPLWSRVLPPPTILKCGRI